MRLDVFLKSVGIVKRRPEAARLLKAGLVTVDDRPAKPAQTIRPGQRIRLERTRFVREFEVLEIPLRSVAKADFPRYARLLAETVKPAPPA